MMRLKPPALTAVQWVLAAAALLFVLWLAWWIATSPAREAATAAKARADGAFADSRGKSAGEAAVITDRAVKGAAADEDLTRENADAIRNACPGPDCNRTALRRVCHREAYRHHPDCLQFARGAEPAR